MKIIVLDNVAAFIENLEPKEIAKVLHTLELLELFVHALALPHSRHMKEGLLDLLVSGRIAILIMYCFHEQDAVLLHAFIKKTQQTPKGEIDAARTHKKHL